MSFLFVLLYVHYVHFPCRFFFPVNLFLYPAMSNHSHMLKSEWMSERACTIAICLLNLHGDEKGC